MSMVPDVVKAVPSADFFKKEILSSLEELHDFQQHKKHVLLNPKGGHLKIVQR